MKLQSAVPLHAEYVVDMFDEMRAPVLDSNGKGRQGCKNWIWLYGWN